MNIINQETGSPATGAPQSEPQQPAATPSESPSAPAEPQAPAAPAEGQPADGGNAPQGN